MIRRNKKSRKYHAPSAKVTHMALESNFCNTVRFKVQVDELYNVNSAVDPEKVDTAEDPFYFEF